MKKLWIIAAAIIVAVSCKEPSEAKFEDKNTMGMYDSGNNALFAFNRNLHQIGFLPSERSSRVQDDTPEVLFQCRLDKAPDYGSDIMLTLSGKNVAQYAGLYTVRLTKKYGDYIWLWSDQSGYGFVLYWGN